VQIDTDVSSHTYMALGFDNSWSQKTFEENFRIVINRGLRGGPKSTAQEDELLEFDIVGVDPAIVNALRRILLAEVPTVAIEHVFMINNTSIIAVCSLSGNYTHTVPLQAPVPACNCCYLL
jgi:DNA-directed RNA polymerases I and III subunit RPAC1